MENTPDLWLKVLPSPQKEAHKYNRGHALIFGAPELTGATRLASEACARVGAGLTTVLSNPETAPIYKASLPAHIMVRDDVSWRDQRITAMLFGPGGLPVRPEFQAKIPVVLDADALQNMPSSLSADYVLTPHEGEFKRAFPHLSGSREDLALTAAKQMGAFIVLKGPQTIIASPDGQIAINNNAPPTLATAGSGDVLAGLITGLLAQGMPSFQASCAAVWMHGRAAQIMGPGLVASDLPDLIPHVLQELLGFPSDIG
ncbi:MAG: NAD(P)H-hydrate dehydratase [Alphaproteobacteria bacterium]|nr:NAD(P)H-hydrate dehydratase [Alphaproteobacteria bacterium]